MKIEMIRYNYNDSAEVVEGYRYTYPGGTTRFEKEFHGCRLCGLSGSTYCTDEANCLNISLADELRAKLPKPNYKIIAVRLMGIGIVRTGVEINGSKYWHFRKGDYIRNNIMKEGGVIIDRPDGSTEIRYNSDYQM